MKRFKSADPGLKEKCLHSTLLKDTFAVKIYNKRLLIQIKEKEMYKIITNKAFTDDEDSPLKNRTP